MPPVEAGGGVDSPSTRLESAPTCSESILEFALRLGELHFNAFKAVLKMFL